QMAEINDLLKQIADAIERNKLLEKQVKEKESQAEASARRAKEITSQLGMAEKKSKEFQALADLVPGLRDDLKKLRERLGREEATARALEKEVAKKTEELGDKSKQMLALEAAKGALERKVEGVAAAEKRAVALQKELDQTRKELAESGKSVT